MTSLASGPATPSESGGTTSNPRPLSRVGSRQGSSRRWRRAFLTPSAIFGLAWIGLVAVAAIFGHWLTPHSPFTQNLGNASAGMSANNWLGTDYLGRDIFARIIAGASVSLWVPAAVVGLSLVGAIPIGLIAGYRGGRTDQILMRLVDSGLSFPPLVMAMAVVAVLGAGEEDAVIALAVVFTPALARLVRGQTVAVRAESFVEASRSLGSSSTFISLRRVLPNIMSVLVVQATLIMSTTLIAEAGLSFLGLGAQPPAATWGSMLQQAYSYSLFVQPWSLFWPGAAIALTVLAFNSLGDAFTSAFGLVRPSPSQRRRPRGIRGRRGLTAVERGGVASEAVASPTTACLEVRDLSVSVAVEAGQLTVVDGVSLTIEPGEILGLVGESGSGKTVTSMAVMRLLPSPPFVITGGSVLLDGRDLLSMELGEMRKVRGSDIAMVFQDPMSSLNPAQTVGAQISEAIRLHRGASRREAWQRAVDLLDRVGIPDAAKRARSYPHQLSGGMRQRVMIAMALSCGPRLIIADEPTTALDVTVQAQVMQLLRDLAREENVAVLFVTHDLAVVSELCDRVVVMYAGQIVESASTADVFVAPRHPYTEGLIGASRHSSDGRRPQAILGQVPQLDNMPRGCRFAPRCQYVEAACVSTPQVLAPVADEALSRALEKQDQQQLSRCRREHDLELGGVR